MEPRWLTLELVRALHDQAIALFGGSDGVRDAGLLESALNRPRHLYAYGSEPTIFDLGASYCYGIVRNHPFIDGNKRAGLLTARAFLFRNGYLLEADEADEVAAIVGLAAGELEEAALSAWMKANCLVRTQ